LSDGIVRAGLIAGYPFFTRTSMPGGLPVATVSLSVLQLNFAHFVTSE